MRNKILIAGALATVFLSTTVNVEAATGTEGKDEATKLHSLAVPGTGVTAPAVGGPSAAPILPTVEPAKPAAKPLVEDKGKAPAPVTVPKKLAAMPATPLPLTAPPAESSDDEAEGDVKAAAPTPTPIASPEVAPTVRRGVQPRIGGVMSPSQAATKDAPPAAPTKAAPPAAPTKAAPPAAPTKAAPPAAPTAFPSAAPAVSVDAVAEAVHSALGDDQNIPETAGKNADYNLLSRRDKIAVLAKVQEILNDEEDSAVATVPAAAATPAPAPAPAKAAAAAPAKAAAAAPQRGTAPRRF